MQTQPKASHFVNGAYLEDSAGEKIDVIYPATGAVIAQVHAATPAVIEAALASAKAAQPAWAAMTGTQRGRILRRAADMIRDQNRALSTLETYDTGKPLSETLYVDATSAAGCVGILWRAGGQYHGRTNPAGTRFRLYHPRSPWRVRGDRGLELSHADRRLERRACARLR